MSAAGNFTGDVSISGALSVGGALTIGGGVTGQSRSGLTQDDLQSYPLPLEDFRQHDAYQTVLGSAGSDDLGITTGTFGTGLPYIGSGDSKTVSTTRRARILFTLPPEYVSGETIQLRFAAGMITTVADTSATIDAEVYLSARTTLKSGSDLCTTSAQSINSLTFAEKTFTINPVGRAAGDVFDIRVTIAIVDAATGTAVIGAIAHAEMQLDIKG